MRSLTRKALRYILLATVFGASSTAMAQRGPVLRSGSGTAHVESLNGGNIPQPRIAASAVTVTPATGARFAIGQKFDIRVEGKGNGPFSATLTINNGSGAVPLTFTSGAQNTTTTDGISAAGYGGFNLRGYSIATPGTYTLTATFTDSTGTVTQTSQVQVFDVRGNRRPAKNVIILLGDGMGIAHTTAAQIVKFGVTAGHPNGQLAMQQFPGTGLVSTHSLNSIITDSAPGMSCYVSGNHNFNGQEGVFPANVTNAFFGPRVEYMSEYLHRTQGKSLGLVSTADIEDATPAANAVHTLNRGAGQGICDQYLDESDWQGTGTFGTGLSVLMGGGRRWFLPSGTFGGSRSASNDYPALPADLVAGWNLPATAAGGVDASRNLLGDFQAAGFTYASDGSTLAGAFSAGTPNKLLGLFGYGNMNVTLDKIAKRRGTLLPGATTFAVDDYYAPNQPMLDEMTDAAIKVLSKNANGFTLMVEGAHIDKQAHFMDADRSIEEVIEFDNAVAVAKQYADQLGDTVVIVLADHECSGFALIGALTGGINNLQSLADDRATTAPGTQPNRQKVVGTYDSAGFPKYTILADGYPATFDIDGKLLVGFGANADRYEGWQTKPQPVIDSLLPSDIKANLAGTSQPAAHRAYPNPQPINRNTFDQDPFGDSRGFFIRGQAVGADQAVHTATQIPVYAYSSGSRAFQQFYGVQENTDVFFKLMKAVFGGY